MLLSFNWLKEFVPYTGTAEELGEMLTMLGLELEEVTQPYDEISGVVVGRVLTCEAHPDSDHLHVCTVDVGAEEPLPIVCGAPNVAAGQLVCVAPVGATLPGGLVMKKAKLRGVPSFGMICSEREMQLSEDHNGILVLPETNRSGRKPALGEKFVDAYELDREVLDISITPNRADCLSVLGFARIVSAYLGLPVTLPSFTLEEKGEDMSGAVPVEVRDGGLCPSYTGRILKGAKVAPSPAWMRWRLNAVGVRAISNLVDVTNYILMELGQPLHAFDHNRLAGGRIIVREAADGEKITTLDGQERLLRAGDGLICDAEKPVALAGVMGGLETEITGESESVFLECAVFRPRSIRMTARRLALNSEASYRYERGVDPTGMAFALDRAAALMAELSGADVCRGICACTPQPWKAPEIRFRRAKAEGLLGVSLTDEFCRRTLESLGCTVEAVSSDEWNVKAPGWRYDLTREADLIEEIAIFNGVDSLEGTLPSIPQVLARFGEPEGRHAFMMRVKHWAAGLGMNEAVNYSFVGNRDLDHLGLPREGRVVIMNPLTAEQDVLRTELAPGLFQNVRQNISQGASGVRLFEVAEAFTADPASDTTVREVRHLAMVLYGSRYEESWAHADEDMDYIDIKGIVEKLFAYLGLAKPSFSMAEGHPYLAPAVAVKLADGREAGVIGRLKPALADEYLARKAVWYADVDMDLLRAESSVSRRVFRQLPVYPAVKRDVTFIASRSVLVQDVLSAVSGVKTSLLEGAELLDVYEPKDSGSRNITVRLTFRRADRTLQDGEVDKEREKIVSGVVKALGVTI
ncbi:MAG: phenylalanine--tRNA ligase subunit beta [Mailhella sp.]|nr:phenylalanine--tRNA ligase subunit beta [Mailhella sp.]